MPATEGQRQPVMSQGIPFKRIVLNDPSQLPIDYSSTPGGTLYSTTPGGTRIVYERATLMHLRNSPLSRTPPKIPDFLSKGITVSPIAKENGHVSPVKKGTHELSPVDESHEQFDMDI